MADCPTRSVVEAEEVERDPLAATAGAIRVVVDERNGLVAMRVAVSRRMPMSDGNLGIICTDVSFDAVGVFAAGTCVIAAEVVAGVVFNVPGGRVGGVDSYMNLAPRNYYVFVAGR
jgi:hypothetical protein